MESRWCIGVVVEEVQKDQSQKRDRKKTKVFEDSDSEGDLEIVCLNDWENWFESEDEIDQDINSDIEILDGLYAQLTSIIYIDYYLGITSYNQVIIHIDNLIMLNNR